MSERANTSGGPRFRFTLQHALAFHAVWLLIAVVNVWLTGRFSLFDGTAIPLVCGVGGIVGLLCSVKEERRNAHPSLRPFILGMVKAICLTVLVGLLLGVYRVTVCTRTREAALHLWLGVIRLRVADPTEEQRVIKSSLRYAPAERHWLPTTDGVWFAHGHSGLRRQYPILEWSADDLQLLAHLEPVEKSHIIFHWESELDLRLADIRSRARTELLYRLGRLGGERRDMTDAQIVNDWWREFEPLLRPLESEQDLAQAVADFKARGPQDQYFQLHASNLR